MLACRPHEVTSSQAYSTKIIQIKVYKVYFTILSLIPVVVFGFFQHLQNFANFGKIMLHESLPGFIRPPLTWYLTTITSFCVIFGACWSRGICAQISKKVKLKWLTQRVKPQGFFSIDASEKGHNVNDLVLFDVSVSVEYWPFRSDRKLRKVEHWASYYCAKIGRRVTQSSFC